MRYLITLVALVWTLALAGCASLSGVEEPLQVNLADVSMLEFGLVEQKLGLKLRIQNPNNVAVPIEGLSYEFELNGKPFAQGVGHPQTQVPEFGYAEIDTEAVSNLASLFRQLGQLGQEQKLRYRLKGKLYSDRWQGGHPFETEGEISLPDFTGWKKQLEQSP